MSEYILELNHITKTFPGVRALDDVHFNLKPGEIHALMGENGAGKSTFIKVITGVHQPDGGEIFWNGEPVVMKTPLDAQKIGISAIYQHVTCYPDLSVTENIFIGHETVNPMTRRIGWKQMHIEAEKLLAQLDADVDPRTRMGNLSVAQQQIIEIAKALSTNARVIIMDEPTAALTNRESEDLYRIIEGLRADGVSIIFISHRVEDIYRLADRVTVFRDAKYIGTWKMEDIRHDRLITAMVGREITQLFPKREVPIGRPVLEVQGLSRMGFFKDISFTLHRGEILAITGLVGAGRTEVCEAVFGITSFDSGKVLLEGSELHITHPKEALEKGIGYLPEDRQRQGLVLDWDIGRNVTLSALEEFSRLSFMDRKKENRKAATLAERLEIKAGSVFVRASALSGGNQQKTIVAKLLTADLKVIILDEPTKGVDVGAKLAIYTIMCDLAAQGYGIIMISSEMPEVLGMSDRIVVMREGRVTASLETAKTTQEEILRAAMASGDGNKNSVKGVSE